MPTAPQRSSIIRFGEYDIDLQARELRRSGVRLKLSGQPLEVLVLLLEQPGEVVTREQIQKRLWPGTFVDYDHNLNAAVNRIREVLGDSAETPRFVETLPRRGYRFIASVDSSPKDCPAEAIAPSENAPQVKTAAPRRRSRLLAGAIAILVIAASAVVLLLMRGSKPAQRSLTRLTFDDGLQIGATWSPDGRFVAYAADRGGKFDIWMQQVGGANPVQVTRGPGQNWQPDWSPDGKYIAYRSEREGGGIYVIPAIGGAGLERKITSFGYYPRWSPDSSELLFEANMSRVTDQPFYVVKLDGTAPRPVLQQLFANREMVGLAAAWAPGSKRISVWIESMLKMNPSFWTVPEDGGAAVKSEIPTDMERSLWADLGRDEYVQNFRFCWAPSGKAIYFERSLNGARNLWRMTMDPATLRATGLERLTTGPGTDTELSLSSNGKMLAFTGATQQVRGWLFPLNADRGVVTGPGQAITSPGIEAWTLTLSPDGKKLGWGGVRTNQWELWQRTLADGSETPIGSQGPHTANLVVWSPDGTRLAYSRENPSTGEFQIVEWSSLDRTETPVLKPFPIYQQVYDWSPDGKSLLISQGKKGSGSPEIWQVMLASPPALSTERLAVASDKYELYQAHFSPDGRWIAFEAVRPSPAGVESALYVMPAAGGPWIRLTDGQHWDDKPRWSPDGKVIYFISGRTNFYGVWGIHFDPQHGRPVGEPFLLKAFDNPSMTVPTNISAVDISVRRGSLVVPLQQLSGGIWILDNVDQ